MNTFVKDVLSVPKLYKTIPKRLSPILFFLPVYGVLGSVGKLYFYYTNRELEIVMIVSIIIGGIMDYIFLVKRNVDYFKNNSKKIAVYYCLGVMVILIGAAILMFLVLGRIGKP